MKIKPQPGDLRQKMAVEARNSGRHFAANQVGY
jgi:hypothetical protein